MDHFGMGAAIRGVVTTYLNSARRTGRTTSLVESVKDGDRIVFGDSREAGRVRRLCLHRGVTVECIVLDPMQPGRLFELGTSKGRTIFDHTWVEDYYLRTLQRAQAEIDNMQRQASGFGEAHLETRRKAEQLQRAWEG